MSARTTNDVLLWVDVETTGLDPGCVLLEIAVVVTEFDDALTMVSRQPFSIALGLPADLRFKEIDPTVLEMHAANGLWRQCMASKMTEQMVAAELYHEFRRLELWNGPTVHFAGRSVHFDKGWVERRLLDALEYLNVSHRVFDLTSIKAFATLAGFTLTEHESNHRALDDVLGDIQTARDLIAAMKAR